MSAPDALRHDACPGCGRTAPQRFAAGCAPYSPPEAFCPRCGFDLPRHDAEPHPLDRPARHDPADTP